MRTQFYANTISRVFGNRQDSRIVAGTRNGHVMALAHALPAWHLYAAQAAWCASIIEDAMKQACTGMARRLTRSSAGSPSPVVERVRVRLVPSVSVGGV